MNPYSSFSQLCEAKDLSFSRHEVWHLVTSAPSGWWTGLERPVQLLALEAKSGHALVSDNYGNIHRIVGLNFVPNHHQSLSSSVSLNKNKQTQKDQICQTKTQLRAASLLASLIGT